jgi:DNA (cytosine-5)-methyltransferase 1
MGVKKNRTIRDESFDNYFTYQNIENISHYLLTGNKIFSPTNKNYDKSDLLELNWLKTKFLKKKAIEFTFIDLFAGIGGIRIAAERNGGHCLFSSEWDKYAKRTYFENFGEVPFGDIRNIGSIDIPKHNLLFAGFPCQAFSLAGKRNGFEDTRGTLFFDVARIINDKKPEAFVLENVKGLVSHDKGKTLEIILSVLRDDLGYYVPTPEVLNSKNFGTPQNRERIFIVGFKNKKHFARFNYPKGTLTKKTVKDIIDLKVDGIYYLSQKYLDTLKRHKSRHSDKGNGFGYEVLSSKSIANAVVVGGMGRERNLIKQRSRRKLIPSKFSHGVINDEYIRKLTPREMARLQSFEDSYIFPVSDAQAYKQIGNSVTISVLESVIKEVLKAWKGN